MHQFCPFLLGWLLKTEYWWRLVGSPPSPVEALTLSTWRKAERSSRWLTSGPTPIPQRSRPGTTWLLSPGHLHLAAAAARAWRHRRPHQTPANRGVSFRANGATHAAARDHYLNGRSRSVTAALLLKARSPPARPAQHAARVRLVLWLSPTMPPTANGLRNVHGSRGAGRQRETPNERSRHGRTAPLPSLLVWKSVHLRPEQQTGPLCLFLRGRHLRSTQTRRVTVATGRACCPVHNKEGDTKPLQWDMMQIWFDNTDKQGFFSF